MLVCCRDSQRRCAGFQTTITDPIAEVLTSDRWANALIRGPRTAAAMPEAHMPTALPPLTGSSGTIATFGKSRSRRGHENARGVFSTMKRRTLCALSILRHPLTTKPTTVAGCAVVLRYVEEIVVVRRVRADGQVARASGRAGQSVPQPRRGRPRTGLIATPRV